MAVQAAYQIDDKQLADMDLSITITMTVAEWRTFIHQTREKQWPAAAVGGALLNAMEDLKRATEKHYSYPSEGTDD